MEQNLEIQTELAASRLQELQEMLDKNKNLTKQVENLKMNVSFIGLGIEISFMQFIRVQLKPLFSVKKHSDRNHQDIY